MTTSGKRTDEPIDLIVGLAAIAAFLGVPPHQADRMRAQLPIFTLNGRLMARRSSLWEAIEQRERDRLETLPDGTVRPAPAKARTRGVAA